MKTPLALTLWQPWVDLVALGLKRFETRSWPTAYRGPLYIHAAKKPLGIDGTHWIGWNQPVINAALRGLPFHMKECRGATPERWQIQHWIETMPFGAIVAVCDLASVITSEMVLPLVDETPEQVFGDYSPRRYAWKLENVRIVHPAVPCRGGQRLWIPTPKTVGDVAAALAQQAAGKEG